MTAAKRAEVSAANLARIERAIDAKLARLNDAAWWLDWLEWRDWQEEKRAAQRGVL